MADGPEVSAGFTLAVAAAAVFVVTVAFVIVAAAAVFVVTVAFVTVAGAAVFGVAGVDFAAVAGPAGFTDTAAVGTVADFAVVDGGAAMWPGFFTLVVLSALVAVVGLESTGTLALPVGAQCTALVVERVKARLRHARATLNMLSVITFCAYTWLDWLVLISIVRYSLAMDPQNNISVLFLGDVIGKPGRRVIKRFLSEEAAKVHLIIANAENAAHGFGTTEGNLDELREAGVAAFTGGNHTFDRKEILEFIDKQQNVIRPANYPQGTPGQGSCIVELEEGLAVGIINVMGRVFMEPLESPFLVAEALVEKLRERTKVIIVDIHAEATAEKIALALYLDGRVSAVIGTHTHVQTADERILPGGTAFLTDAGCCGPTDGVIGMDKESVFRRMVKQLPSRFEVAAGPAMVNGVYLDIDSVTGKALSIRRVQFKEDVEPKEESSPANVSELSQKV